jgi:hypothetical protein
MINKYRTICLTDHLGSENTHFKMYCPLYVASLEQDIELARTMLEFVAENTDQGWLEEQVDNTLEKIKPILEEIEK